MWFVCVVILIYYDLWLSELADIIPIVGLSWMQIKQNKNKNRPWWMFKNQCNVDVDEIGGFDLDLTIGYFPFLICPNDLHFSRKIVYFMQL